MADMWAIIQILEDIDLFCQSNPTEFGKLSQNSELQEYLFMRMGQLYSSEGQKVQ